MVSGGVERITLSLIRGFQREGHECALALRRAQGEFLDEAKSLCTVREIAGRGLHQFVPHLAGLIRTWQPTHVVTAFADVGVLTWLAMRMAQRRPRWVHGVHNTHAPVIARSGTKGRIRFRLDIRCGAFVYRHADAIVAVSNGVRDEIIDDFHIAPERVTRIYNPVVPHAELCPVAEPRHDPAEPYSIVAVGRLARQKGFDILIEAMTRVPGSWRLDIWGEGGDRQMLQALIADRGLQGRISLRGYTSEPFSVLRRADLFVLSSRWEGLPTVVIEALACQCQVVATDCPQGPREILEDGRFGQLVPAEQPNALGEAITRAVSGHACVGPAQMLKRAHEFSSDVACVLWLELLRGVQETNG
jgi:glycosyltransferase involved in cell wall biosynthesis